MSIRAPHLRSAPPHLRSATLNHVSRRPSSSAPTERNPSPVCSGGCTSFSSSPLVPSSSSVAINPLCSCALQLYAAPLLNHFLSSIVAGISSNGDRHHQLHNSHNSSLPFLLLPRQHLSLRPASTTSKSRSHGASAGSSGHELGRLRRQPLAPISSPAPIEQISPFLRSPGSNSWEELFCSTLDVETMEQPPAILRKSLH